MTTPMTRDEIVELMAREKAKYAGYDPDETWEEFDRNAAATDFMCGGVPDDEIFPRYIRWKEYAAECDAILRALEAAGCQIVQGEPVAKAEVAWLVEFPESGDFYRDRKRVGPAIPIQWYCAVQHGDRILCRTSDANEALRIAVEALERLAALNEFLNGEPSCTEEVMNYTQYVSRQALAKIKELRK